MDKFFFSSKNVNRQSNNLGKILNINESPESMNKCRKFLMQQMKTTFKKYGKKRPAGMSTHKFVDLLNKKSIRECVKIMNEKGKNRDSRKYNPRQISQYERDRNTEVYGQRDIHLPKRPQYTSMNKENNNSAMPGFSDGAGMAGFAPIASGHGEFITADGRMGDKFQIGSGGDNSMFSNNKKDMLEQRMLERQREYDPRASGMGGMGGMGGHE